MRRVYSLAVVAAFAGATVGCRRDAPPPLVAEVSGTIEVAGLHAPVRVIRDTWGIPHIHAETQDDLFFAQGFVQAQDRLFQMDLWRRSRQGRLSQVLGPNFIERDAMTRRVQYRGPLDVEWASYGPDVRAIAEAFVRGINARVAMARDNPPEEFRLAGWKPEYWSAVDLLNRTDAFLASGDAIAEARRAGLSEVIVEALERVGAPPFFAGLAGDVRGADDTGGRSAQPQRGEVLQRDVSRSLVYSPGGATATRGGTVSFSESPRALTAPSARYFVHLIAPEWNVIGATAPWLPGVAAGHNERIAWAMAPIDVDTEDVYVETGWKSAGAAGAARTTVTDAVIVKGRRAPFVFTTDITPHGIVIALDREHDRAFTLRWSGTQPGAAAELAALGLDRAQDWTAFRAALARWKMPARRLVYGDTAGSIGYQDAALLPVRRGLEWIGWTGLDDLPHAFNPSAAVAAGGESSDRSSTARPDVVFAHLLGITRAAQQRFDVGPLDRRRGDDGPVQGTFDPRAWDRSRVLNAPGQSESPASPHVRDLAALWSGGADVPLAFTDAAVAGSQRSVLTLAPSAARP